MATSEFDSTRAAPQLSDPDLSWPFRMSAIFSSYCCYRDTNTTVTHGSSAAPIITIVTNTSIHARAYVRQTLRPFTEVKPASRGHLALHILRPHDVISLPIMTFYGRDMPSVIRRQISLFTIGRSLPWSTSPAPDKHQVTLVIAAAFS